MARKLHRADRRPPRIEKFFPPGAPSLPNPSPNGAAAPGESSMRKFLPLVPTAVCAALLGLAAAASAQIKVGVVTSSTEIGRAHV